MANLLTFLTVLVQLYATPPAAHSQRIEEILKSPPSELKDVKKTLSSEPNEIVTWFEKAVSNYGYIRNHFPKQKGKNKWAFPLEFRLWLLEHIESEAKRHRFHNGQNTVIQFATEEDPIVLLMRLMMRGFLDEEERVRDSAIGRFKALYWQLASEHQTRLSASLSSIAGAPGVEQSTLDACAVANLTMTDVGPRMARVLCDWRERTSRDAKLWMFRILRKRIRQIRLSPEVQEALIPYVWDTDKVVRYQAENLFYDHVIPSPIEGEARQAIPKGQMTSRTVQAILTKVGLNGTEGSVTELGSALYLLGRNFRTARDLSVEVTQLFLAALSHPQRDIRKQAIQSLVVVQPNDLEIQKRLVEILADYEEDTTLSVGAGSALGYQSGRDFGSVHDELKKDVFDHFERLAFKGTNYSAEDLRRLKVWAELCHYNYPLDANILGRMTAIWLRLYQKGIAPGFHFELTDVQEELRHTGRMVRRYLKKLSKQDREALDPALVEAARGRLTTLAQADLEFADECLTLLDGKARKQVSILEILQKKDEVAWSSLSRAKIFDFLVKGRNDVDEALAQVIKESPEFGRVVVQTLFDKNLYNFPHLVKTHMAFLDKVGEEPVIQTLLTGFQLVAARRGLLPWDNEAYLKKAQGLGPTYPFMEKLLESSPAQKCIRALTEEDEAA